MKSAQSPVVERRYRNMLIAAIAVVVFSVLSLLAYLIWSGYREAILAAHTKTRGYAAILETRLEATLRRVEANLRDLAVTIPVAALDTSGKQTAGRDAGALDAMLDLHMREFPEVTGLRVFDARGALRYTSGRASAPPATGVDRDYFRLLRDDPHADLVFSETIRGRASKQTLVVAAKAIRDGQGRFHGVVYAALDVEYFEKLFSALDVGDAGVVAVFRNDDFSRVARWPPSGGELNAKLPPDSPTLAALPPGTKTATVEIAAITDAVVRIYSYHQLDRYPFFVAVGVGRDETLAAWRTRSLVVGLSGLLFTAALMSLMFLLLRARDLNEEKEEVMRSTFEQAAVGTAHFSADTRRFLRANEQYCKLLGYAKSELIGMDIRDLVPADEVNDRAHERLQVAAGEMATSINELRYIRKDGTMLWVNRSLSVVRDAAGQPKYFISVIEDISVRKQVDEARGRLAAVAESSNDAIFIRNVDGCIVYWNDGARRMYGYAMDEAVGKESEFLVPPDRQDERRQNWEKLQQGLTLANFETVRLRKDGTRIDVSISVSPVRDHNGQFIGIATVARDITARKQADNARALLAAIVDGSSDAIVSRSLDRRVLSWNRGAERLFGYRAEEVIGESISFLIPPDRMEEAARNRAKIEQASPVIDLETVRLAKGGRRIDVSLSQSPVYDEHGKMAGVALVFRDIGERARKTALIHLLESLARATNEATTPEAAMQACLDRICAYGNWQFGRFVLFAPGQTTGVAPTALWHCADESRFAEFVRLSGTRNYNRPDGQFVGRAIRERKAVWIEEFVRVPNFGRAGIVDGFGLRSGFVFPVFVGDEIAGFAEFFATEVRTPDEMLLEVIHSVVSQLARLIERGRAETDLARLNVELEMRVANRTAELEAVNTELSDFSYTIAHDLRAPVRAINGFSSMVLGANEGRLDPVSTGHLRRVLAGSERMGHLIDDLLNLARLSRQEVQRENFNLSDMANHVTAALAEAHPVRRVQVVVQPAMMANGDAGLMRIVMDNLIGNAWKFTANTAAAKIEVGVDQRDGPAVYSVSDNGAGFDMQYAGKLFAPFQRLHHASEFEGTGIGLATVKKIIQRHGGNIWVESTLNAGTTVFFTLG